MQLEAADWSIQATPPVHLQGFTPTNGKFSPAANKWTLAKRFNYLFQQGRANPGGFRTVDIWNNTLDLYVTSRWLGGGA